MTEGPLGFPMTDGQASAADAFLRIAAGPFQHLAIKTLPLEHNSRTDISWITTESPDRYNHVVLADGMDDSAYAANPIVTLNHDYTSPPIGRSLWRKQAQRAGTRGIQAMTHYPPRPSGFTADWPPDLVFAQILAGLLNAKSIGFIPLEILPPENPDFPLVVKRWALIEYAVGTIPVNPEAILLQVNKTLPTPLAVSFASRLAAIDLNKIIQNYLDTARGNV